MLKLKHKAFHNSAEPLTLKAFALGGGEPSWCKLLHPFVKNNINAFTLSEVLITLAIIGIISALTIPTLISNYTYRAFQTNADVFEKKITEAIRIMNTQQVLAGYVTTEDFVSELKKHLKIINVCDTNTLTNCFEDSVVWGGGTKQQTVDMKLIKLSKHFGQYYWNTNIVGIQFANGVIGLIAYNPECVEYPYSNESDFQSCYALLYDTNGFAKPNTSGRDIGSINVKSLNGKCAFVLNNVCYSPLFKPDFVTKAECEEMIKSGEYGIKNCYYTEDYWAGAVKACGHTNNLPTTKQLTDIASYVYGINVTETGTTEGSRNDEKAGELGFKNVSSLNNISLWSGSQYSQGGANLRHFKKDKTNQSGHSKSDGGIRAFCVVK